MKFTVEIDSPDILQPGPGVLEGVKKISAIIEKWRGKSSRYDADSDGIRMNEKLSDQVKEKPGDRYSDNDADGGRKPPATPLGGFDRG